MTINLKQLYLDGVERVWHQGEVAALDQTFAPDYVRNEEAQPATNSRERVARLVEEMRKSIADLRYDVTHITVENDLIAARFTVTGTHVDSWRGIEPEGCRIHVEGMSFNRVEGDRIVEGWVLTDMHRLEGQMRGHRARVNNTELFHTSLGHGAPILTMHGGMGLDHTCFRPWLDGLADRHELVYYDQRGNGRSSREGLADTGIGTWADDADALRAHLGLEKVIVLGHSFGGYVAVEYAARYPERVAALILVSVAPALDYPDLIAANLKSRDASAVQMACIQRAFSTGATDDPDFAKTWNEILPLYFHQPKRELLQQMNRGAVYSAAGFNRSLQALAGFDTLGRLASVRAKTLVLGGDDDFITPFAVGPTRMASAISGAKLHKIAGAGHIPFAEQTKQTLAAIRDFL